MKIAALSLLGFALVLVGGCESQTGQLSVRQVEDYLDGRPLVLPENVVTQPSQVRPGEQIVATGTTGQPVAITTKPVVIQRANISALTIGSAQRLTDTNWIAPVTFLYQDTANRDAVVAVVEYTFTRGTVVFLGFRVEKIAKQ